MNKTYSSIGVLAICLLVFCTASTVEARTVIRTGDAVSVAKDQSIEGDFYSAASVINISGEIEEDMVATGVNVTINGGIGSDVFIAGGTVDVHGTVGDDLRVVAGEVIIAKPVEGDVFVLGRKVSILSTASVSGDVILYADEANIEGSVGGDVIGVVKKARIDGPVAGGVDITTAKLTLGDRADVVGSVSYVSSDLAIRAPNAVVSGDMVRSDPVVAPVRMGIKAVAIPLSVVLFSSLAWYLLSRKSLQRVTNKALAKSPRAILIGFACVFCTPIAIAALLMSVIGSVLGMILLFGYLLFFLLSVLALPAMFGQLVLPLFTKEKPQVTLLGLVFGVILLFGILFVPVLGSFIVVGAILLALGACVDMLLHARVQ